MFQDNAPIAGRADAESNFIQNSEQYDVIFLIDNDVDERQRPAAATAARTVGTIFRLDDRDVLQSLTICDISI